MGNLSFTWNNIVEYNMISLIYSTQLQHGADIRGKPWSVLIHNDQAQEVVGFGGGGQEVVLGVVSWELGCRVMRHWIRPQGLEL